MPVEENVMKNINALEKKKDFIKLIEGEDLTDALDSVGFVELRKPERMIVGEGEHTGSYSVKAGVYTKKGHEEYFEDVGCAGEVGNSHRLGKKGVGATGLEPVTPAV